MVSSELSRQHDDVADAGAFLQEDAPASPAVVAPEPTSVEDIGLPDQILSDLTLKMIRHLGKPSAYGLSERMAVPPPVLNEVLDEMKTDGLVEIGGAVGGRLDLSGL